MGIFYPLYVRRSDGKLETIGKGKRREKNTPTDEQLDQRPDRNGVSDFYREVGPDEVKSLDWRRKLGGMLARELSWRDKNGQDTGCMLVTFPEGYRLYEHVKRTEKDGKTQVKSKTHAAAGNDRQDAYLYGHPAGRKKRFRSPVEFFPHLLWLATDDSGDPDNCSCKICSPEELENAIPGAKAKTDRVIKQDPDPRSFATQTAPSAGRQLNAQALRSTQEPAASTSRPKAPLVPTALPPKKSNDQIVDSQYNSFMYRPGELAWFQNGQAWGLGIVTKRWARPGRHHHYTVQPLSHPWEHPAPVTKSSNQEMRPWLAWSVPRFTANGLNALADPPRYETADWQGMMQKRYGNGNMVVDASILAAKSIDSSYTLLGLNRTGQPESGIDDKHYDAIFLGAEKIWIGDPIRINIGGSAGTEIMVVHDILERRRTSAMVQQVLQQQCLLVGDIYSLATVQHTNPNLPSPAAPNNNPHLPLRLTEDLGQRNSKSIPVRGLASYWKLVAARVSVDIKEVKGRWYEATVLLPLLMPDQFNEAARKGEVGEASLWMNSRGDCLNSNRASNLPKVEKVIVRKDTRKDALGKAVPPSTQIEDGVEPPPPGSLDPALTAGDDSEIMEIDPRFDTADRGEQSGGGGDDGLDEFMNLDADAGMEGFGQEFGEQIF
ncbi:Transcription-silencing protein, cryptic loci regulator Clr2 [Teratosphaeria destructans]|uniref:Transcription-silencing protein, cryptic loci regulator Clr2 n=1 Tax=Teratosphaeria destructans TaxID=418781 RepID=A0A9W7VZ39_9PEZI|nr:Transcription-silencing protein, cryptic loci regulator Clr2 [Teratosphaeria destructans]